jgi:hypothetical protein
MPFFVVMYCSLDMAEVTVDQFVRVEIESYNKGRDARVNGFDVINDNPYEELSWQWLSFIIGYVVIDSMNPLSNEDVDLFNAFRGSE